MLPSSTRRRCFAAAKKKLHWSQHVIFILEPAPTHPDTPHHSLLSKDITGRKTTTALNWSSNSLTEQSEKKNIPHKFNFCSTATMRSNKILSSQCSHRCLWHKRKITKVCLLRNHVGKYLHMHNWYQWFFIKNDDHNWEEDEEHEYFLHRKRWACFCFWG